MVEPVESISPIIDALRQHTGDHCFACGRANPIGLQIDNFRMDGDEVLADFVGRSDLAGTVGNLHGGIAATALDEILVWAGIITHQVLSVTARLELRYKQPVSTEDRLGLRGRVEERRGRRLLISGSLNAEGSGVSVTARGLYVISHTIDQIMEDLGNPEDQ